MKNNFLKILIILIIALLGVFAIISCEKSSNKENNVVRVGFYTDSDIKFGIP